MIDCGKPINAIAINPLRPYQLAMATSDSVVRVVDRRTISVQGNIIYRITRLLRTFIETPKNIVF